MSSKPVISVVIPLFNKAAYVVEAVTSVLAQRWPALEVVVVDDGSTDDGAERVLALDDARVRLVRQANSGVSSARNHGIALARGDFVAFLDADDRHHADYLATVAALVASYPEAGVFCTAYSRVDGHGNRSDITHPGLAPGRSGLLADFYADWSRATFTFTSAITVRRGLLASMAQPFPVGERLGEDQDLWFRLAEAAPIAFCNRPLADYRVDVAGSATQAHPVADVLPCYRRLAQRLDARQIPLRLQAGARRLLASHLINLARAQASAGQFGRAAALLREPGARGNLLYWLRSSVWLAGVWLDQRGRQ